MSEPRKSKAETKPQATQQIAALAPSRMPIVGSIARQFDISADQWRVLVDQIFPSAKTVEAVGMALAYCRARKLDIFKRPVHIVPMWSTVLNRMVETVWPGIAEIRTTAARTGQYAGIDEVIYGPMVEREFVGEKEIWANGRSTGNFEEVRRTVRFPEWASVVVYRMLNGQRHAYNAKVFWEEAYASNGKTGLPNDMWAKRPRGQLDKCVEAAALRKAFPEEIGNDMTAEEMEGRTIDGAVNHAAAVPDAEAQRITASSPPPPPPEDEEATDVQEFDAAEFGAKIEALLSEQTDEDSLVAMWEAERVDELLADHQDWLDNLYDLRNRRIRIFDGEDEPEEEGGEEPSVS